MRYSLVRLAVPALALGLGASPVRAAEDGVAAIAPDSGIFAAGSQVTQSGRAAMPEPGHAASRSGAGRRSRQAEPAIVAAGEAFTVDAGLTVVSDYRGRGVSASAGKAALQGEVAVAHRSGFEASVWASSVAENGGANIEIDAYAGYARGFGPFKAELGVMAYVYPGARATNYYEIQGSLGLALGKARMAANAAYGPHQSGFGGEDNLYVELTGEVPLGKTAVTLEGGIGVEHGFFGDNKVDWRLGATYAFKGFELGVTYIDTARAFGTPDSGATVVGSLGKSF